MKVEKLTITTDASGDGSASTGQLNGYLQKIRYAKTDYADGVDFTVSDHTGETLFTGTNVNASASYHPTEDSVDETGATRVYAAAGEAVAAAIPVAGPLTVTVAQGGNAKTGDFYFWVG